MSITYPQHPEQTVGPRRQGGFMSGFLTGLSAAGLFTANLLPRPTPRTTTPHDDWQAVGDYLTGAAQKHGRRTD